MINIRYKITCLLLIGIIVPLGISAQQIFQGQVFKEAGNSPISKITVTLQKEKLATSTNGQGYFFLSSQAAQLNDTLVFSGVGYSTVRLAVANFSNGMQILLKESINVLEQVDISGRKIRVLQLNEFSYANIKEDPEHSVVTSPYTSTFQYAKLFTAPEENVTLLQVQLGRRDFNPSFPPKNVWGFPNRPLIKSNPHTRFMLHILDAGTKNGAPGKILFSKEVSLDDWSLLITVDLSKDNIQLQERKFFLAIEWLRIPYNELVKLNYAPKLNKVKANGKQVLEDVADYEILYQPALVRYMGWKPAQSWVMGPNGLWHMIPSGRTSKAPDIALSATIKY